MRLFLPWKGWHVRFQQELQEYPDLLDELEPVNNNLMDEPFEEAVLQVTYDIGRLLGRPEVCWIKEAWFWTNYDGIEFPEEEVRDHLCDTCMGQSLLYHDYDQILEALAKVHDPVRWLLEVSRSGPSAARSLARAVLEGDRSGLPVLADALEEAGHALAAQVRKTANAKAKRRALDCNLEGKGPPLPSPTGSPPGNQAAGRKGAGGKKKGKAGTAQEVVLIGGYPCGGKTGLASTLTGQGYVRLNRDEQGGKVDDLLPLLAERLRAGQSVVLDNLYATRESRAGVVQAARRAGVPVRFLLLDTSLEDAQFNACLRMIEKCGRVLHPEDHKRAPYKGDPSLYPVAVLYKYRNDFEEPTSAEGFASVEKVKFVRRYPPEWAHKAVIFDFDGTLRNHEGREKFPVHPSEVRAFRPRAELIRRYAAQDYLLLGASNQSGVAKGKVSAADVEACFAETLRQLGLEFAQVLYCPHKVPPISCYCRKPGPGMGVELIVKHRLDPRQCIYVGDAGTDRSFAQRCGFTFVEQAEFFKA
jgi:HAD superfamily hydrolase (TIGR01662 family)